MFFLSVDCHFQQEISENDLETTLIPEFYPPPAGKHKTEEDFNILYHVYCRPPKEKKEKKEKEKPKGNLIFMYLETKPINFFIFLFIYQILL